MTEQEIIKIIRSNFSKETIFQLTQIKNFIDSSLKDFACKTFNKEEDKIRYLIESLHNIKDFTVVVTNEDAVRNNILNQIHKINQETELGNELEKQKEKQLKSQEEKLEQAQSL